LCAVDGIDIDGLRCSCNPGQQRRASESRIVSSDAWQSGVAYERFMGRWSRLASAAFVHWLDRPAGGVWIDVGMGTGALTQSILDTEQPAQVVGVEPSSALREVARRRLTDDRATVVAGDADSIPLPDEFANTVASSFVLNFVPDTMSALREMRRCTAAGGSVAAVVWDYADGMGFLRHFWTAAAQLDPSAHWLDEGNRFPICGRDPLQFVFDAAGFVDVRVAALEIETRFEDLHDFWEPFLGGTGPAPAYLARLTAPQRQRLHAELAQRLPVEPDGSIRLRARAWAVTGTAARPHA
jgi:SAM-dependent methyltransferase